MKFFNINQTIAISSFSLMMLYAPAGLTQNSQSFGDIATRLNNMICNGAGINCNTQTQVAGQVINNVPGDPLSQPKIQEILKSAIGAFLDEKAQRVAFDFGKFAVQDYQCSILNPYKAASLSQEDRQNMEQIGYEESYRILENTNQNMIDRQYQSVVNNCATSVAADLPALLAAGTGKNIPLSVIMPKTYQCISNIFTGNNIESLERSYQNILNDNIKQDAAYFMHPNNCEADSPGHARVLDVTQQRLNSPVFGNIEDYASRIPMPLIPSEQPPVEPQQQQQINTQQPLIVQPQ